MTEHNVFYLASLVLALVAALALTPVTIRVARAGGRSLASGSYRTGGWCRDLHGRVDRVGLAAAGRCVVADLGGWGAAGALRFVDDRWHLSVTAKLLVQLAGAGILIWGGLLLVPNLPLWVSLRVYVIQRPVQVRP